MTTPQDLSAFTAADLNDATIEAAVLASLTQARPDLWPAILAHPNCYPALGEWIRRNTVPAQPAPTPQQAPRDPSAEQMVAGAKQFATGAKDFFNTRVAPAAAEATRAVQSTVQSTVHNAMEDQQRQASASPTGWMSWAPLALPIAAFLALISLFLPLLSVGGYNLTFFSNGEGGVLLVLLLVVIGLSITSLVLRAKWARIAAAVAGIITGLVVAFDVFGTMGGAAGYAVVSVGIGAVLLAIFSIVILAAAVITLLPKKTSAPTPGA